MREVIMTSLCLALAVLVSGCKESPPQQETKTEPVVKSAEVIAELDAKTVEVGCGMCIFQMEDVQGCKLAVKVDGQPYLVSDSTIDAHTSGLCTSAKQAQVTGTLYSDRFAARDVKLQP